MCPAHLFLHYDYIPIDIFSPNDFSDQFEWLGLGFVDD